MSKFVDSMENGKWTKTENGMNAVSTTGKALVDLFGILGSLRTRSEQEIENLFSLAWKENCEYALRMAFYARDIRGGLGERRTARIIWKWIANNSVLVSNRILNLVPEYGRWDDLFIFIGTSFESYMWDYLKYQFSVDIRNKDAGKAISLLAKWLPSVNTSSQETVKLGKLVAKKFDLTEKQYRKMLSTLRKYLDVTEKKMSANQWTEITYSSVPSKAMNNYRKAFGKHDTDGFSLFIESVKKGDSKINSSTLFPYDIFVKGGFRCGSSWYNDNSTFSFDSMDDVLELQWKALPNYVFGEQNVLVVADTSGSMQGLPMCTAVGLAVYFAERNKGPLANRFITFSEHPEWVILSGDTLEEKVSGIKSIFANTDIEAVFDLILETAVRSNLKSEDLPVSLVIISDGEFDSMTEDAEMTFYDSMKKRYAQYGYTLPNIVFWNVDSRQNVFHAESDVPGVQLATGHNPSVFKSVIENIGTTPYESMVRVLESDRYNKITLGMNYL